jgi:hypothetical protein
VRAAEDRPELEESVLSRVHLLISNVAVTSKLESFSIKFRYDMADFE